jgi:hypothetical protein
MPAHVPVFSRSFVAVPTMSLLHGRTLGGALAQSARFLVLGGCVMRTRTTLAAAALVAAGGLLGWLANAGVPRDPRRDELGKVKDELLYQRATQSYLWALPLLNMRAMKEGSEQTFGAAQERGGSSLSRASVAACCMLGIRWL